MLNKNSKYKYLQPKIKVNITRLNKNNKFIITYILKVRRKKLNKNNKHKNNLLSKIKTYISILNKGSKQITYKLKINIMLLILDKSYK